MSLYYWLLNLINTDPYKDWKLRIPSNLTPKDVTPELAHFAQYTTCPDCGEPSWYMGPSGGASQNIQCGNDNCGSEFNHCLDGLYVIQFDRISEPSPKRK